MKNTEIAKLFYEVADILEMQNIQWKPQAYRKAARSLESLSEDAAEIYKKGGIKALMDIPGVGEGLAKKIAQYIDTGRMNEYEKLKKSIPAGLDRLMDIEGLGPKKIAFLYKRIKIKNLRDLQKAIKKQRIRNLPGFGIKTEENLIKSIEMFEKSHERFLLGVAIPIADKIVDELKKAEGVHMVIAAGSLRRMKETVGDIDILVTSSRPEKAIGKFSAMADVERVIAKGGTKGTVVLKNGLQSDIRVVEDRSFGAALNYFTGSKDHNVRLRQIALGKGMKLSEYGLFNRKTNRFIAGRTEEGLYKKLGMPYIEPELRENTGEIEAALKKRLPDIIGYGDVKGDLQMHTRYSDGSNTIEEMAIAAKALGHSYILITDHSKTRAIANGMSEQMLRKQIAEIDKVNARINGIEILKGAEVDILNDGSLDYPNSILKQLDIAVAAIHSGFKQPEKDMTARILKGLENEYVKIFAHPTGRLISKREPYNVNIDKLTGFAKENNKILEINAFPDRLDLKDTHVRLAIENNVKLSIGTDSHNTEQLANIKLGIATARRGWATKKDIVNTYTLKDLKKLLK